MAVKVSCASRYPTELISATLQQSRCAQRLLEVDDDLTAGRAASGRIHAVGNIGLWRDVHQSRSILLLPLLKKLLF
jgi:hypothetical protein